ncbi:MAG: hypothetical protein EPO37_05945 [Nitrosarchaeum sp.]|nr:MAG: hypothetical protein EPO37_05945 [Nitrosarchaeum sp.]
MEFIFIILSWMILLVPGFDDSVPPTGDKIFKIETSPDIVQSIKVQSDESFDLWGFEIELKQNSTGTLEVKIPKNLPTPASFSNSWYYDERAYALANGTEISYDNIEDPCYSHYKIPIEGKTHLEIVYSVIAAGTWQLYSPIQFDEDNPCYDKVFYEKSHESPLKQFKSGIVPQQMQCKKGLHLVVKSSNNHPACVIPEHIFRLIDFGWVDIDDFSKPPRADEFTDSMKQEILTQLRKGPQNINGTAQEFIVSEALSDKRVLDLLKDTKYQVNCCTYTLDGSKYPYPLYVSVTFQLDEKDMLVTAEYDLQQEKITDVEIKEGIRTSGVVPFESEQLSLYSNKFPNIEERNIRVNVGELRVSQNGLSVIVLEKDSRSEPSRSIMFQQVTPSYSGSFNSNDILYNFFKVSSGEGEENITETYYDKPISNTVIVGNDKEYFSIYFPIEIPLKSSAQNSIIQFNYSLPYLTPDFDRKYSFGLVSLSPLTTHLPDDAKVIRNETSTYSSFWFFDKSGGELSHKTDEYMLYYGTLNPPIKIQNVIVYTVEFELDAKK